MGRAEALYRATPIVETMQGVLAYPLGIQRLEGHSRGLPH
jgi:hypothetical protein